MTYEWTEHAIGFAVPSRVLVSQQFMRTYVRSSAEYNEGLRISASSDVFGPNKIDRRKRKKMIRKAGKAALKVFDGR